jgi:hypothetical protein
VGFTSSRWGSLASFGEWKTADAPLAQKIVDGIIDSTEKARKRNLVATGLKSPILSWARKIVPKIF